MIGWLLGGTVALGLWWLWRTPTSRGDWSDEWYADLERAASRKGWEDAPRWTRPYSQWNEDK